MIKFKLSFVMFVNSLMHASKAATTTSRLHRRQCGVNSSSLCLFRRKTTRRGEIGERRGADRRNGLWCGGCPPRSKQQPRFWQHAASGFFEPSGGECGGCPLSKCAAKPCFSKTWFFFAPTWTKGQTQKLMMHIVFPAVDSSRSSSCGNCC